MVGYFDVFQPISYDNLEEVRVSAAQRFHTLDPSHMSKEPSLILAAQNYGILKRIADGQDLMMTNFGRESTPPFDYRRNNLKDTGNPYSISVGRSQLEMDGVFESEDYVLSVEAKTTQRSDFLARQLYYTYRLLNEQTDKKILNVFMTSSASGSLFTHVYAIDDASNYNSFRLLSAMKYNFFDGITITEIADIVQKTGTVEDPADAIFPQADSMNKVFDTLGPVAENPGIRDTDIAYNLAIEPRQGGYYGNACEYLGLTVSRKIGGYKHKLRHAGRGGDSEERPEVTQSQDDGAYGET